MIDRPRMDPTPSLWDGILLRAAALRRRYGHLSNGPQSTWSLVNRAAVRFADGDLPTEDDRDRAYALWTRAMCSVLNDLHRRSRLEDAQRSETSPAETEPPPSADSDHGLIELLGESMSELADLDRRMGEQKSMILALRYFEGLPWNDVAEILGSSVGVVRREWQLARAWLRREMKRRGAELE